MCGVVTWRTWRGVFTGEGGVRLGRKRNYGIITQAGREGKGYYNITQLQQRDPPPLRRRSTPGLALCLLRRLRATRRGKCKVEERAYRAAVGVVCQASMPEPVVHDSRLSCPGQRRGALQAVVASAVKRAAVPRYCCRSSRVPTPTSTPIGKQRPSHVAPRGHLSRPVIARQVDERDEDVESVGREVLVVVAVDSVDVPVLSAIARTRNDASPHCARRALSQRGLDKREPEPLFPWQQRVELELCLDVGNVDSPSLASPFHAGGGERSDGRARPVSLLVRVLFRLGSALAPPETYRKPPIFSSHPSRSTSLPRSSASVHPLRRASPSRRR